MYNNKSLKAEEFISHDEIIDTLAYAEENKANMPLIREILDKAAKRGGLDHREASVLLACEDEAVIEELYALAKQIKKDFNELYQQMNGMELREMDKIIYPVCKLCRDHERAGFVEGIKLGIILAGELAG